MVMGKAKWWVCDDCHSLNDLPANKCYKCRAAKPANPRQMDDKYSEVGSQRRVGITVDLSQLGDLTRPDPVETQSGGGVFEAFGDDGARSAQPDAPARQLYDPYGSLPEPPGPPATVRPLREPKRRGIDQLGGVRSWAETPTQPMAPPPADAVPPPVPSGPPAGAVPPPGTTPQAAPYPPQPPASPPRDPRPEEQHRGG